MILTENELSNRDLNYKSDYLRWLNQEITRYRDYEWKSTSFHTAFFIAILYILIDPAKRQYLLNASCFTAIAIIIYGGFAIAQLVYIHWKLNKRRNERNELLKSIGAKYAYKKITKWWGFNEGIGVIFIIGFIILLIILIIIDLILLFDPYTYPLSSVTDQISFL